jgi:hypothetical protein
MKSNNSMRRKSQVHENPLEEVEYDFKREEFPEAERNSK